MKGHILIRIGSVALICLLPAVVWADDFNVGTSAGLQLALDAAATNGEDDVIHLPDSSLETASGFEYTSNEPNALEIRGALAGGSALVSIGDARVLSIQTTGGSAASPVAISLSKVLISNGSPAVIFGGGLAIVARYGDVLVEDCTFSGNRSELGAGGGAWIGVEEFGKGKATIRQSRFVDNQASRGAGLYVSFPEVTLESNLFRDNVLQPTGFCQGGGAWVNGSPGPVSVLRNRFVRNEGDSVVSSCRGGGLYLRSGGTRTTTVQANIFHQNQLGNDGEGAGAYLSRVDGPLLVVGNRFEENLIGGTENERGGGGLRASLFGSFAEVSVLNNAFVGNRSLGPGTGAWIDSLDTPVEFSNNTAINNHAPRGVSDAVRIDAHTANLRNNIVRENKVRNDVRVAERSFGTVRVTLTHNNMQSWSAPSDAIVQKFGNQNVDPELGPYPDFHITSRDSPVVDTGIAYAGSPLLDIDGDERTIDGKLNGDVRIDIGADELDPQLMRLSPSSLHIVAEEALSAAAFSATGRFTLTNIGQEEFEITDLYLTEGSTPATEWGISLADVIVGNVVRRGDTQNITIWFWPDSLSHKHAPNTLVVETTAGTVSAELTGDVVRLPYSDSDGVPDRMESGPGGLDEDFDGNCDGTPDLAQSHVASLKTRQGRDGESHYVTIVAPMEVIGTRGELYGPDQVPVLQEIQAVSAADGANVSGYEGFRFNVTTSRPHTDAGSSFPISILFPEDGPAVDGYMKRGPTPAGWKISGREAGWVGEYDFTLPSDRHEHLEIGHVGADVEPDVRFPCLDYEDEEGDWVEVHRNVVHLRLRDGWLGDGDLMADAIVVEPGAPTIHLTDDRDRDGVQDEQDNCPDIPNLYQRDADGNGVGDACTCGYTSSSGVALSGDANRDSIVNGADYTLWADHFGMPNPGFEDGDFNCDGSIDGADYTLWADNFGAVKLPVRTDEGEAGGRAAAAAPSSCGLGFELVLLVPALLGIAALARRRVGSLLR